MNTTDLKRCTSQNKPVSSGVILVQSLRQLGLDVLHPVSFIDNHVNPFDLGQQRSFLDDVLVRRHTDLEVARSNSGILLPSG
jgi:hypothetical protein